MLPKPPIFKVGDILIDPHSNEVGLLTERYDVFEGYFNLEDEETRNIWAWEILWSGSKLKKDNRKQSYTELGLVSLVRSKKLKLIKLEDREETFDQDNNE